MTCPVCGHSGAPPDALVVVYDKRNSAMIIVSASGNVWADDQAADEHFVWALERLAAMYVALNPPQEPL